MVLYPWPVMLLAAASLSCHAPQVAQARCRRPGLPLAVYFTPEARGHAERWMVAGEEWSLVLGATAFHIVEDATIADVVVYWGGRHPRHPNWYASMSEHCHGDRLAYSVEIHQDLDERESYYVGQHELGHVLGLDHAEEAESVMYPTLDVGPGALRPMPIITWRDAKIVRSLWLDEAWTDE